MEYWAVLVCVDDKRLNPPIALFNNKDQAEWFRLELIKEQPSACYRIEALTLSLRIEWVLA